MIDELPIDLIDPDPSQARRHFDPAKLEDLAASLGATGLAVPILVRPVGARYVIVHGERRWRAARSLGWKALRAEVRDLTVEQARWLALAENVQRANLTPIEEAEAYRAITASGVTQTELGRRIGKGQSYIAQKLRLLNLPGSIRLFLARGAITEGHARLLLRFRTFLDGETHRFPSPVIDGDIDWDNFSHTTQVFINLRPIDADFWVPMPSSPGMGLIRDAGRAFCADVRDGDGTIPTWTLAAFWYAAFTAHCKMSVAELAQTIDGWEWFILSAVAHVALEFHPVPDEYEGREQDYLTPAYWGHRSDLRHARIEHWAQTPPRRIYLEAFKTAMGRGLSLPSSHRLRQLREERSMSRDMAEGGEGDWNQ